MSAGPVYHLQSVIQAPRETMDNFEGPLDLILHLLARGKIEIADLQISLLCEQFLQWIEERQRLDMDVASEFITMASHLVYMKSRKLLTYGDEAEVEIDELKLQLEERLLTEERTKLARAVEFLRPRDEQYRFYLPKPPEPLPKPEGYHYIHDPGELIRALDGLFLREEKRAPPEASVFEHIVGKEPYPISDKADQLLRVLEKCTILSLRTFFITAGDVSELVASFLAVLELCKEHKLDIIDREDDEIWLTMA